MLLDVLHAKLSLQSFCTVHIQGFCQELVAFSLPPPMWHQLMIELLRARTQSHDTLLLLILQQRSKKLLLLASTTSR